VKIAPLSQAELANVAPLSEIEQWIALRRIRKGKGYKSYWDGIHLNELEIFNASVPLFDVSGAPDEQIRRMVEQVCATKQERQANDEVYLGLRKFVVENDIKGRQYNFGRLPLRVGGTVSYWSNVLIDFEGRRYVPLVDPRKTETKLTSPLGIKFAMSMQDTHIRAADPTQFGKVGLLIIQFEDTVVDGVRKAIPIFEDGSKLWSFSEIQNMVERTYQIWEAVLKERAKRRAA
jgi:hypothetical protein